MAGSIQSLEKAILILSELENRKGSMSLQELSAKLNIPKSTLHGLLSTMRRHSLIDQSPEDGKYMLGVRLFELGNAVSRSWDAVSISHTHMQAIASQTGESVSLFMPDKGDALIVDHADSGRPLAVTAGNGTRFPMYCTAAGKLFLAHMKPTEADYILRTYGMQSHTPHTITDLDAMAAELENIRRAGCAIEDGEYRIGLRAVAAPIYGMSGTVVFALGVTGMFRRTTEGYFLEARRLVIEAAERISFELGYRK